ncbi:MAG: hypothetical protein ABI830_00090 [Pseudolabrys sp.]
MTSFGAIIGDLWPKIWGLISIRRGNTPIDDFAKLQDFVATRSAYVGQKTLYSYVKARMGIRYPAMFANDKVMASLNIAKMHVFAGCLSDLTIHAVGVALHDQPVGNDERQAMALRCYEHGLQGNAAAAPAEFSVQDSISEFTNRAAATDWRVAARAPENFTASPKALYRWAPIAEELKKFDAVIVANSMKFAWRDILEQFHKRIDPAAVAADWARQPGN